MLFRFEVKNENYFRDGGVEWLEGSQAMTPEEQKYLFTSPSDRLRSREISRLKISLDKRSGFGYRRLG